MNTQYVIGLMNSPGWQLFCGPQYWYLTRSGQVKVVPNEVATALLRESLVHLFDARHGEYMLTARGVDMCESSGVSWLRALIIFLGSAGTLFLVWLLMLMVFRRV